MGEDWLERTELLIGENGIKRLQRAKVIIFGIGGVGSYVAEGLARSGLGCLVLVDHDVLAVSNLNRQLPALRSTLGRYKAQVMKERIGEINPLAEVEACCVRYEASLAGRFFAGDCDYVVDAIDDVAAKVSIAVECQARGRPLIASMGAGNRLEAESFRVEDIAVSSGDPLARRYRRLLKEEGISQGVKVLYSPCPPLKIQRKEGGPHVGSVSFVPSVAGLLIAGEVVRDLLQTV